MAESLPIIILKKILKEIDRKSEIRIQIELGQTKHPKPSGCFGGSPFKKREH
jgi:hypothetical protein